MWYREKGECAFATKCVVDYLNYLGHKKVSLTCVQEDSIMSLKTSAKRKWNGDSGPEESPTYESQSNGSVEMQINKSKAWCEHTEMP